MSECDHCFVWGGPAQEGTMTASVVDRILRQAQEAGGIDWIWFEGGEPFLYFPLLEWSVRRAFEAGFKVGLVTNGYWAVSSEDAPLYLRPLQPYLTQLDVSSDEYHLPAVPAERAARAAQAAESLGIIAEIVSVAPPADLDAPSRRGLLPAGESRVMCRGRASAKLAPLIPGRPIEELIECPHENLRNPERLHVDALGFVQICQGISNGNVMNKSLGEIFRDYDPGAGPVTEALLQGGPALFARRSGLPLHSCYADACHLCYETRSGLRERYPNVLAPDPMYGPPAPLLRDGMAPGKT
ncbi:MAG: radical SAM protein [Acidobacteriota bacterium]